MIVFYNLISNPHQQACNPLVFLWSLLNKERNDFKMILLSTPCKELFLKLRFNCSSDVDQIRVLFAYNKTQTCINNIITLISLLSIGTQPQEGKKWLKKPICCDMFMIPELKSKHVEGLQMLRAVM